MRASDPTYEITRADVEDIDALIAVDLGASTLFTGTGLLSDEELLDHVPKTVFEEAIPARDVFVARHMKTAEPVGFTLTSQRGETLYLDQISVHPDHGKNGLGKRLMERIVEDAKERGFKQMTLSTFKDVAWNAPFYASLGFKPIKPEKMDDWMRELETAQAASLDVTKRCFMRKRLRWI